MVRMILMLVLTAIMLIAAAAGIGKADNLYNCARLQAAGYAVMPIAGNCYTEVGAGRYLPVMAASRPMTPEEIEDRTH